MRRDLLEALERRLRKSTKEFSIHRYETCACGLACEMSEFKGLVMRNGMPEFAGVQGLDAMARVLEIRVHQASELFGFFDYGSEPTAVDVANRIRKLLRERSDEV